MLDSRRVYKGFALPTVLIASVVMLIVLSGAVSQTVSIRSSLLDQNYIKLAKISARAGVTYARACLEANDYVPTWSDISPLKPNTDCSGVETTDCTLIINDPTCYVSSNGETYTTFSVGLPLVASWGKLLTIPSNGITQLLKSSDGAVWRTYEGSVSTRIDRTVPGDGLPVGTSISGYWDNDNELPFGYLAEDGSAVSRTRYSSLFAVIGETFGGGNGSTTFNIPDSRGYATVNIDGGDPDFDEIGEKQGATTHALTTAQIPPHSHGGSTGSGGGHSHDLDVMGGWSRLSWGTGNTSYSNGLRIPTSSTDSHTRATGSSTAGHSARLNGFTGGGSHSHGASTNSRGDGDAHNNIQPSIVKKSAIKYVPPVDPNQSKLEPGSSISGYWPQAPEGYLFEDGSAVSRTDYGALYSAIEETFGAGDGSTTFNLPDSRGRVGVNMDVTDSDFNGMGEVRGNKAETLDVSQLPSHDHSGSIGSAGNHSHGLSIQGGWSRLSWGTGSKSASGYLRIPTSTTSSNQRATGSSSSAARLYGTDTQSSHSHSVSIGSVGSGGPHNNIQPSIVKRTVIKSAPASSEAAAPATGTSIHTYDDFTPEGYLFEDGSAVSRNEYSDLYLAIGTTFGTGDGSTTFNLPDSRGRVAVNLKSDSASFNGLGSTLGSKTHVLSAAEMPSHSHSVSTNSAGYHTHGLSTYGGFSRLSWGTGSKSQSGTQRIPTSSPSANQRSTGSTGSGVNARLLGSTSDGSHSHSLLVGNNGSGSAHNNVQPSIVMRAYIKY